MVGVVAESAQGGERCLQLKLNAWIFDVRDVITLSTVLIDSIGA